MPIPGIPFLAFLFSSAGNVATGVSIVGAAGNLGKYLGIDLPFAEILSGKLEREEFDSALKRARVRFRGNHPLVEASFFDEQLLTRVARELVERPGTISDVSSATSEAVSTWCKLVGERVGEQYIDEVRAAADDFFRLLEQELFKSDVWQPVLTALYFQESKGQQRGMRELLDLILELVVEGNNSAAYALAVREGGTPAPPPNEELALASPGKLIDRDEDLQWLVESLSQVTSQNAIVLHGIGGIGKTALAAEGVRKAVQEGRFPDGIVVIEGTNRRDTGQVLRTIIARFRADRREPVAADAPALAGEAKALLSGKKPLVVLDGIEPDLAIGDVTRLLVDIGVTVLITARHIVSRALIPGILSREITSLSASDSVALFCIALGRDDTSGLTEDEDANIRQIVEALGGHPLAIKLAGTYAAEYQRDLSLLALELSKPEAGLELPEGDTPRAVALIFHRSLDTLDEATQVLFAALACFETDDFGRDAAIAVAGGVGQNPISARRSVDRLIQRGILTPWTMPTDSIGKGTARQKGQERLRVHPLLHAFSRQRFEELPEDSRSAFVLALGLYYTTHVMNVSVSELSADSPNIIGVLEWAIAHGLAEIVAPLCLRMQYVWRERGQVPVAMHYLPFGISAAETMADTSDSRRDKIWVSAQLLTLGQMLTHIFEVEQAKPLLARALDINRAVESASGEGACLNALAMVAMLQGDETQATSLAESALTILRKANDRHGEANSLVMLAQIKQQRKEFAEAEKLANRALSLLQGLGEHHDEAATRMILGELAMARGFGKKGEEYVKESLAMLRELQSSRDVGIALCTLGHWEVEHDHLEEARGYFAEAQTILHNVAFPRKEAEARYWLGCIDLRLAKKYAERGEPEHAEMVTHLQNAEANFDAALELYASSHDTLKAAAVTSFLAQIAALRGDANTAHSKYVEAEHMLREIGEELNYSGILVRHGVFLAKQLHEKKRGCKLLAEAMKIQVRLKVTLAPADSAIEQLRVIGCRR